MSFEPTAVFKCRGTNVLIWLIPVVAGQNPLLLRAEVTGEMKESHLLEELPVWALRRHLRAEAMIGMRVLLRLPEILT
jgi:hypothetical protein